MKYHNLIAYLISQNKKKDTLFNSSNKNSVIQP
jgi:hypothetical protein